MLLSYYFLLLEVDFLLVDFLVVVFLPGDLDLVFFFVAGLLPFLTVFLAAILITSLHPDIYVVEG